MSLKRSLRHRAFFQAAGQFAEGTHEYHLMVAGLLTLRLLDKSQLLDVVPVQRAIEKVDDTPIKRALSALVDSITRFSSGEFDTRPTRLITYARFLERERFWEPAADAYATAIQLLDTTGREPDLLPMCYARSARCVRQIPRLREAAELISTGLDIVGRQTDDYWRFNLLVAMAMVTGDLLIQDNDWSAAEAAFRGGISLLATREVDRQDLLSCHERTAYCLRQLGHQQEAAVLLNTALDMANALHDLRWSLYLRISHAVMIRQAGDLSAADFELETVIAEARSAHERDILGRALQERGVLAQERREFRRAIAFHQEAAGTFLEERMKRRALVDTAISLMELGELSAARDALRQFRDTSEVDVEARTTAGLNLLEIAWKSGDRGEFDRYRAELARERMSGRLRGYFYLMAGQGLRHFGNESAARVAFRKARTLAQQFHLDKLQADAQAHLD